MMTEHNTAVRVDVYRDEFKPIMKALKYALCCDSKDALFTREEADMLESFLDNFVDIALNEAV
jgi:hypothetical protein